MDENAGLSALAGGQRRHQQSVPAASTGVFRFSPLNLKWTEKQMTTLVLQPVGSDEDVQAFLNATFNGDILQRDQKEGEARTGSPSQSQVRSWKPHGRTAFELGGWWTTLDISITGFTWGASRALLTLGRRVL